MERLFFPALIADFDGTVRYAKDGGFINGPSDVACYDGVFEKLWNYRDHGFIVLGLTNQGGVAHGHKTVEDVVDEVRRMKDIAESRGFRWPYHDWHAAIFKEDGTVQKFAARSLSRKPNYGGLAVMSYRLRSEDLYVRWDDSLLVGDNEDHDHRCARNAGIAFLAADRWREMSREEALCEVQRQSEQAPSKSVS